MSESAESYIGTNWREFVQELYASLFKHSRADIVETLSCWGDFLSKCWVRRPYWIQWNPLTRMSKAQSRNISLVIVQPTREDLWIGSLHIHKTISALIFADKHGCHWLFTLQTFTTMQLTLFSNTVTIHVVLTKISSIHHITMKYSQVTRIFWGMGFC